MSHWKNFPASSFMTDFEIIVIQNERARWRRERMEQQSTNYSPEQDYENAEDALVTNILLRVDPAHVPVPLTPIHPTPSPTLGVDITNPAEDVPITRDNQAEIEEQLDDQIQSNTESNDSSSSGSYQSVQSSNTPTKIISTTNEDPVLQINEEEPVIQTTEDDQHNQVVAVPILFRGNNTMFMTDVNEMNVKNKKRTILISVVRPSFHRPQNEFFICHVCHRKPRQIKMVEELWDVAEEKDNNSLGDEVPFAYNLRGIIDHLTNHHCLTHVFDDRRKSRDMVRAVANYIDMVNKDIEVFSSPMFRFEDLIPKASSTSCLHVSWKTDQPELTMELAHNYNFRGHTSYCKGHSKSTAPKQTDFKCLQYELDLANTVYCSCSAPTIDLKNMNQPCGPAAKEIFDLKLNIFQENTFFNQERKSIHQSHKAVLCHFKISQPWPKFPPRTYQPVKPITRKDTREKLIQDSQEKNQEKNQQETSSKATTSSNNQSSSNQQKLSENSCQIHPTGEVRLRPEGRSPPIPSPPEQDQPQAEALAGNSVVAKVVHAVATAGFLLKKPAQKRKSDWV